ncbi:putative glucose-6-phosphate isomerase [Rosa chinensis]|uniref:Putative glucose-6-phosphate isomerase n=1 Tax=Rosa chinensis TaxID=74649 RepID=A0A2P6QFI1_ROSCH|nr:glucose-6-phosphate isomerase 1, chloroplastic isoform X2 [Rosa chinensis]PRQ32946.1 putative glucose-6-phosphate isomerase [Rosa chinensis]
MRVKNNPAALLALCWYWATDGLGSKDMVVLPYMDSLLLFSRYLQQLVMEPIGKEFDLDSNRDLQCTETKGARISMSEFSIYFIRFI